MEARQRVWYPNISLLISAEVGVYSTRPGGFRLYSEDSVHLSLPTIEAIYWVKMTLLGTGEAVQGYEKHLQVTP